VFFVVRRISVSQPPICCDRSIIGLRALVAEGAKKQERDALTLRWYATVETAPRHVRDASALNASPIRWTSGSVPCNANADAS
jgi:hypothetical protein